MNLSPQAAQSTHTALGSSAKSFAPRAASKYSWIFFGCLAGTSFGICNVFIGEMSIRSIQYSRIMISTGYMLFTFFLLAHQLYFFPKKRYSIRNQSG